MRYLENKLVHYQDMTLVGLLDTFVHVAAWACTHIDLAASSQMLMIGLEVDRNEKHTCSASVSSPPVRLSVSISVDYSSRRYHYLDTHLQRLDREALRLR